MTPPPASGPTAGLAPAEATLRAALHELLVDQTRSPASASAPSADAAPALNAFFVRHGTPAASEHERSRWAHVVQRLVADAALAGPLVVEPAALLRGPGQRFEESVELDALVPFWQQARDGGLLDEDLAADFGEFWRRLEWAALRQHLALLAAPHPAERELQAKVVKTALRYVDFTPLKRLLEVRWPDLFDEGFSLR